MGSTKNQAAIRFLKNLTAAFSRWKIDESTRDLYADKLSKWKLSEEIWNRALSLIVGNESNEHLPMLAVIYGYLKAAQAQRTSETGLHWILFTTPDGLRCVIKVKDPANIPILPSGAADQHLCIDPHREDDDYKPIYGHEARAAFAQGYLESGANPEDIDKMFAEANRALMVRT